MGIRDCLQDVADTLIRLPFWLLIEAILSQRFYPILKSFAFLFEWTSTIPSLQSNPVPTQVLLFLIFCTCLLAALLKPWGLLVFTSLALTVASICFNSLSYVAMLHYVPQIQWYRLRFPLELLRAYWASSGLTLLLVLFSQNLAAYPRWVGWKRSAVTFLIFFSLPYLAALLVVSFGLLIVPSEAQEGPTFLLNLRTNSTPVWMTYYLLWVPSGLDDPQVCFAADEPDLFWMFTLTTVWFLFVKFYALQWCMPYSRIVYLISRCINAQLEQLEALGVYAFLSAHWNRLHMGRVLAFVWSFKVILVMALGPKVWSILPPTTVTSTTAAGLPEAQLPNISFLHNYAQAGGENESTLLTRLSVGALVHGSETWLMVFGAAAFFGGLSVVLVHALTLFLDPSGENVQRIRLVAADVPVDVRGWNAIDDPELAAHQNDVQTAEMLSNVGWNCAILFLFLAFQYDLPSLRLNERIYCSVYGMLVMLITCVHPIQGLIKSLLLRLGRPGRDVAWFAHVRPLCTCVLLMSTCTALLSLVPNAMSEPLLGEDHIGQAVNRDGLQPGAEATQQPIPFSFATGLYNVRFHSSFDSMRVRRFRLFLCAGQLVLSLLGNLIEYGIYQRLLRQPEWTGFRTSFFWTKLVTQLADYLISLFSFLTVCWLTVYDSVGVCRVLIICCYFHFILYPSTHRAYTWFRWKLFAERSLRQFAQPTEEQLARLADNCAICYSEMTGITAVLTPCGHIYHTECLTRWMARLPLCPMCHSDLLSNSVKDLRQLPLAVPTPEAGLVAD